MLSTKTNVSKEQRKGTAMSEREQKFERMLLDIKKEYATTESKMQKLKAEGKVKSVTYKQLMSTKLTLQNMLSRYEIYGLLDNGTGKAFDDI